MEPLKKYQLEEDGFSVLKRILLSSPGCHFNPDILGRKRINLDTLSQNVPTGGAITLFAYGKKHDKQTLSAEDVILAFASALHAQDTWRWLNLDLGYLSEMGKKGFVLEGEDRKRRFFFVHLLNPVSVTGILDERLEVKYQNSPLVISVLGVFAGNLSVRVGEQVAIHSGCLICKLNNDLANAILEQQRKSEEIWSLYLQLGKIPHIDLENDFGASLFQFNKGNFQKYQL